MLCQFIEIEGAERNERGARAVRCSVCGFTTAPTASPVDRVYAECLGTQRPRRARLGDRLKLLLTSWGIYPEHFQVRPGSYVVCGGMHCWIERTPEAIPCGCPERQAALNKVDELVETRLKKLARWIRRRLTRS